MPRASVCRRLGAGCDHVLRAVLVAIGQLRAKSFEPARARRIGVDACPRGAAKSALPSSEALFYGVPGGGLGSKVSWTAFGYGISSLLTLKPSMSRRFSVRLTS